MADYAEMSIEDLESVIQSLDADIQALREQKKVVSDALEQKVLLANAERRLGNMSTQERRAMVQYLELVGVESEENHGA